MHTPSSHLWWHLLLLDIKHGQQWQRKIFFLGEKRKNSIVKEKENFGSHVVKLEKIIH
jgi:hypothetical protein